MQITCLMNYKNIDSLPDQLLFEILLLLPADFLFETARLVCRRWARIIHSRDFIETQTHHSSPYGLLLSAHSRSPIYVTSTQGRIEISELSYKCRTQIYASCNGLTIELLSKDKPNPGLRVTNPATKQQFVVRQHHEEDLFVHEHQYCIAYSAASMEYKVVVPFISSENRLQSQRQLRVVGILTVGKDESWRELSVRHLSEEALWLFNQPPLTTEGFLHWGIKRCCLTLNVETEIFTYSEIPLPPQDFKHYYKCCYYLSSGKNLSALLSCRDNSWEVWEMKSENGEWRKPSPRKIEFEAKEWDIDYPCDIDYPFGYEVIRPIGWVKYLELLAFSITPMGGRTCIIYNLDTDEINTIDLSYYYNGVAHRNTLEWLS